MEVQDSTAPTPTRQMIVFSVGSEAFATDISTTREVIRLEGITPVPGVPAAIAGITNMRGHILPLIELGELLHLGIHTALEAFVLVVDIPGSEVVGMIVDKVLEIRHFAADEITAAPKVLGSKVSPDFIAGVILPKTAADKEQVILLIDLAATINKSTAEMLERVKDTRAAANVSGEEV
jgi:purine-binding chemotaxis protein CheW